MNYDDIEEHDYQFKFSHLIWIFIGGVILFILYQALDVWTDPKKRAEFKSLPSYEARETAAIDCVQKAPSSLDGATTLDAMKLAVATVEGSGKYVKPKGWLAVQAGKKRWEVTFHIDVNEVENVYKWIIEDGAIIPANDLAQSVSRRSPVPSAALSLL